MEFPLTNSFSEMGQMADMRLYVAVPLLFCFMLHYIFLAIAHIRQLEKGRRLRMEDHGMRLIAYSLAALLSMNFLQYSLAFPILAWACLITTLLNHAAVLFRDIKQPHLNYLLVAHYGCLTAWYASIMASYLYNAYS